MSIQHDQLAHVSDIEMGAAVQSLEESTSSVPNTANEPVINIILDEENNKSEINNGNETVNIHPPCNSDIEFDRSSVQVPVSSSDEEGYYIIDSQEMQPDPDSNDHNLLAMPMVHYSGDVNAPANEVNGLERLPADMTPY